MADEFTGDDLNAIPDLPLPEEEMSSVPEAVAAERAKHPVMPAGAAETLNRIPLRMFLSLAVTDPGQTARIGEMINDFAGLQPGTKWNVDPGGTILLTDPRGQTTPLDPAAFTGGPMETVADLASAIRYVPQGVGAFAGGAAMAPIAGATGQPQFAAGGAAVGAGLGEAARQYLIEEPTTRAFLGERPARTGGEVAAEVGMAAGGELVGGALNYGSRKALRATGLMPSAVEERLFVEADPATQRLRARAEAADLRGAKHVHIPPMERAGPLYRSFLGQLRNLTNVGRGAQIERSNVVYQLVRDAQNALPGDEAALRGTMEEFEAARRSEGIELARDLTRAQGQPNIDANALYDTAKARVGIYHDKMQAETRANYAAAADALRDAGATLRYDAGKAIEHIDKTSTTRVVEGLDPESGATVRYMIPEDLGPKLADVKSQIEIGQRDGWRSYRLSDGRMVNAEERLHTLIMKLDDLHSNYSNTSSGSLDRGALRVIDGARNELLKALDNPAILNGDPVQVARAIQLRKSANAQFRDYRNIMDRIDALGLGTGGMNAAKFFESFSHGGGTEFLDIVHNVPEIRDATLARYASELEKNPETWAERVIGTKSEVMMELMGGDNPVNRERFANLQSAAHLAKNRAATIRQQLDHETSAIRAAGNVLFGSDRRAAQDFAMQARDLAPDAPERQRVGRAIVAHIYQKSVKEWRPGSSGNIEHAAFTKAMQDMRERGLIDLIPDETLSLLNDVELHGRAAPGTGGMAMGLVSAEAGANIRRAFTVALALGAGLPILGSSKKEEESGVSPTMTALRETGGFVLATEAAALLLTSRHTLPFIRRIAAAAQPQQRLSEQANLMLALGRQSLVGAAAQERERQARRRRDANAPVPAGVH